MNALLLVVLIVGGGVQGSGFRIQDSIPHSPIPNPSAESSTEMYDFDRLVEIRLGRGVLMLSIAVIEGVAFEIGRAACGENPWYLVLGDRHSARFELPAQTSEALLALNDLAILLDDQANRRAIDVYLRRLLEP